jgi:hypothetical protein
VYLSGVSCGAIGIWDYFAAHAADDDSAAFELTVMPDADHVTAIEQA